MKLIKEFVEGERISSQFLVSNVNRGVNNVGSAYYNIELKDSSGTIPGKKWEILEGDDKIFVIGNVINATVEIIKYRDSLQAKIIEATLVDKDDVELERFISVPPIKREILIEAFNRYVSMIKETNLSRLVNYFITKYKDQIFIYPAASSIHHEYSSGLLMHTVSMCKLGEFVANNYPNINKELLLTGIILHDLGKIKELEGPVVYHYSLEGKLLGHISIMAMQIKEASDELGLDKEVSTLVEHMILSHHGQLEYGSPILPLTSEALALHLIDNMDSKLTILNKALDETEVGEYTQKIYPLDGRQFYKHK